MGKVTIMVKESRSQSQYCNCEYCYETGPQSLSFPSGLVQHSSSCDCGGLRDSSPTGGSKLISCDSPTTYTDLEEDRPEVLAYEFLLSNQFGVVSWLEHLQQVFTFTRTIITMNEHRQFLLCYSLWY